MCSVPGRFGESLANKSHVGSQTLLSSVWGRVGVLSKTVGSGSLLLVGWILRPLDYVYDFGEHHSNFLL